MKTKFLGGAHNIIRLVKSATLVQWAAGIAWYDTARSFCAELAETYSLPVAVVAAVVAALSANQSWGNNKRAARKLISFYAAGRRDWETWHIGMRRPTQAAFKILDTQDTACAGIKTSFFSRVIADPADPTNVVVDRWAVRAWLDDPNTAPDYQPREALYHHIADDYRAAARTLGLLPSQAQAIAWVVIREATLGSRLTAYDY